VPLELVVGNEGVVWRDLSIEYVPDKAVGWRVSAWNDKRFRASDVLEESRSWEVKRCSVNEPLDDGLFTFEFPKGAHVAENDGKATKYFIVLGDGERQYVSEREFIGLPPEAPRRAGK
jgi:hypothetical protein